MKLFKRTSIFLFIFIVLIWIGAFVWIYYPSNTVNATENEIKQTQILLKESNIFIDEKILEIKTKSVRTPEIKFFAEDTKLLDDYVSKGSLEKHSENLYMFDKSKLTVEGNTVILEGYSDLIENNTPDTAVMKAKKLISYLNLSTKKMVVYMQERQDGILVTFIPEYKNKPIFDCKVSVMMYGEMRYKVEAVPFKIKKTNSKEMPITVCSALAELALSEKAKYNEITEMTLGYKHENGKLIPAWEIKTKEKNTFYIQ